MAAIGLAMAMVVLFVVFALVPRVVGETHRLSTAPSTGSGSSDAASSSQSVEVPASPGASAQKRCEARLAQRAGRDNPMNVTLVAVFEATAADVAAADERRSGVSASSWRDRPGDEVEAVCWFDADAFGVEPWVLERLGDDAHLVDRIQEVVRPDGEALVHQSGRREALRATNVSEPKTIEQPDTTEQEGPTG